MYGEGTGSGSCGRCPALRCVNVRVYDTARFETMYAEGYGSGSRGRVPSAQVCLYRHMCDTVQLATM